VQANKVTHDFYQLLYTIDSLCIFLTLKDFGGWHYYQGTFLVDMPMLGNVIVLWWR